MTEQEEVFDKIVATKKGHVYASRKGIVAGVRGKYGDSVFRRLSDGRLLFERRNLQTGARDKETVQVDLMCLVSIMLDSL